MGSMRWMCKFIGHVAIAFGVGVLLTYFLSAYILVIIEAIIIITTGVLYLLKNKGRD